MDLSKTLITSLGLVLAGCLVLESTDDTWACKNDGDCGKNERCQLRDDGRGRVCYDAAACRNGDDCDPGWVCHDGRCRPVACDPATYGQCGGFRCTDSLCPTSCGSSWECDRDFGCVRGKCVPLPGIGADCNEQAPCAVGECISSRCASSRALCSGRACGHDLGVWCGDCPDRHVCTESFVCADACASVQCGTFFGIDCGSCEPGLYCSPSGVCTDPCITATCGVIQGVDCGSCSGKTYCGPEATCVDACGTKKCGTANGVDCGTCSATQACNGAGQCKTKICEPLKYYCVGAIRYACDAYGVGRTFVETCPAGTTCEPLGCKAVAP